MQPTTPSQCQATAQRHERASNRAWWLLLAALAAACGGAPERPEVQEVDGTTDHIVVGNATPEVMPKTLAAAAAIATTCEHGTVVECKVWLTEVDCFTGLAVCNGGELSGCMDENAAEAALMEITEAVQ